MPTTFSVSNEERPSVLARTDGADLETRLVQAVLATESVVAITGAAGSGKTALLNRVIPVLSRSKVRVVQIGSPEKEPLDVRQMLDQLIDAAPDSGGDPAQRLVAALTRPRANERQLALFIDDAQTLTDETFDCLGLVATAASVGPLPLQIVLAGRPDMWNRLRAHPTLIANGIATQLAFGPEAGRAREAGSGLVRTVSERGSGPFDDLFEPGPWNLLPEPPVRTGRQLAAPVVRGAGPFKPVPPRAIPTRKDAKGRRKRSGGRLVWAAAAVGLLAALEGATFWDRLPVDEIRDLLGLGAGAGALAGLSGPAPTQPTPAPEGRPPVEAAVTRLAAAEPETAPIVPPTAATPASRPALETPAPVADLPAPQTVAAVAALPQEPSAPPPTAPSPAAPSPATPPAARQVPAAPLPAAPLPAAAPPAAPSLATPSAAVPQPAAPQPASSPPVTPQTAAPSLVASPPAVSAPAVSVAGAATSGPDLAVQPNPAGKAAAPAPASEPPPVETPPAASTPAAASPGFVEALLTRGDALLETGDISAARLLYERAATSNSGRGALAAGMTYDPRFLAQIGSQGIAPDPRAAAAWYRRASNLGETKAAGLLAQLGVQGND